MKILVGTENSGKFIEIGEALSGLPVDLCSPKTCNIHGAPDETGDTYTMNASIKAHYYHALSGLPTIADDSGIMIDALTGELGVQTRRWGAGNEASDAEWISYFLERMQNESNRRARFLCAISFVDAAGKEERFEGSCDGVITDSLEADYLPGLPISACFRPDGSMHVYSAMSTEEKNTISHRGKAVRLLREYLECL